MLTIYKASAGSGKTYTLAYEYIKVLLGINPRTFGREMHYILNAGPHRQPDKHREILAITFTNAATDEMKRRIIRELNLLATSDPGAAYTAKLIAEYGCTPDELADAARKALAEMLFDYGGFNVSTIDSFFQTVLRTFSREVDHQGDYELSLDTRETIKLGVAEMLDELNYAPVSSPRPLREWIRNFALGKMEEGSTYNFFEREGSILRELTQFISSAMDEIYQEHSDDIRRYLADTDAVRQFTDILRERCREPYTEARAKAELFFAEAERAALDTDGYNKTLISIARDIIGNPDAVTKDRLAGKTVAKLLGTLDDDTCESLIVKTYFTKRKLPTAVKEAYKSYLPLLRDAVAQFVATSRRVDVDCLMLKAVGKLQFFGYTLEHLQAYLRDNNQILISDTGELIRRIMGNQTEMPFIYERLGVKLHSLLIDEFQDTSRVQWHNLRPLVGMGVTENHDSLIIGDEKQAIYRFRNSDSTLLGHTVQEEDFPDHSRLRGDLPADNTNHRSSGLIVRFNNTLFSRLAEAAGADSYGNVCQTPAPRLADVPGYVRVMFANRKATKDCPSEVTETDIMHDVARQMLRQHDSGYEWRDILVLVRQGTQAVKFVNFITNTPEYKQIKILSNEALLLNSSEAVRTVMSMVKLVQHSYAEKMLSDIDDPAAPHYATRSEIDLMETRFNYFLAQGDSEPAALEKALAEGDEVRCVADEVRAIRRRNPANLVALIETIIAEKLTPQERTDEHAYLVALQDLAVKHCESPDPSVAAFIAAYDRNIHKWAIKAPADLDAVQIMTIHKSKGLERACVHIPFADYEFFHRSEAEFWLDLDRGYDGIAPEIVPPALHLKVSTSSPVFDASFTYGDRCRKVLHDSVIDALNLCYVAFTRAGRELNVYCYNPSRTADSAKSMGYYLKQVFAARTDLGAPASPLTLSLADGQLADKPDGYADYTDIYVYGKPTVRARRDDAESTASRSSEILAGDYTVVSRDDTRELTVIDDIFADTLDTPDETGKEIVDAPAPGSELMERAASEGILLHAIMAEMRTLADLDYSLARAAVRFSLTDTQKDSYRGRILDAISHGGDTVNRWFAPANTVFAERTIYMAEKDESFRPDRVIVTPEGETIVIDYKFTSRVKESHRRQIEVYVSLLSRLGHGKARGYLWYPLLEKIVEVV